MTVPVSFATGSRSRLSHRRHRRRIPGPPATYAVPRLALFSRAHTCHALPPSCAWPSAPSYGIPFISSPALPSRSLRSARASSAPGNASRLARANHAVRRGAPGPGHVNHPVCPWTSAQSPSATTHRSALRSPQSRREEARRGGCGNRHGTSSIPSTLPFLQTAAPGSVRAGGSCPHVLPSPRAQISRPTHRLQPINRPRSPLSRRPLSPCTARQLPAS